jgi:hypothetical protein
LTSRARTPRHNRRIILIIYIIMCRNSNTIVWFVLNEFLINECVSYCFAVVDCSTRLRMFSVSLLVRLLLVSHRALDLQRKWVGLWKMNCPWRLSSWNYHTASMKQEKCTYFSQFNCFQLCCARYYFFSIH